MKRINLRHIYFTLFLSMTLVAFQNCGEDVNLEVYSKDGGSTGSGSTPTPPPQPAIIAQSPANVNLQENMNGQLTVSVANLTAYSITWYKNGTALTVGAVTGAQNPNSSFLDFAPARLTDAGTYYARITNDAGVLLDSQQIVVSVARDLTDRVYATPSVVFNAQNYAIYGFAGIAQFTTDNAAAFCRVQLGATATLVSFQLNANTETLSLYAYSSTDQLCASNPNRRTFLPGGLCLAFYAPTFQASRFQTITCRPGL